MNNRKYKNYCEKIKKRNELWIGLNKLEKEIKNNILLKVIKYLYYSKILSNSKDDNKNDNK